MVFAPRSVEHPDGGESRSLDSVVSARQFRHGRRAMTRGIRRRFCAFGALLFLVAVAQADITLPSAAPSPPPQADAFTIRILRGDRMIIPLRGHHGGSGTVTFWIVDPPTHGTLSELRVLGDNRATIVYQNDGAESVANDRFTYLVKTSGNRVSSAAEVTIIVEEPPAHLQVPGRIEFEQTMAGESQTRDLAITNDGGGVLEGRLSISSPWRLASLGYRVESGKTETIAVTFRPEEGRDFVGQITLTGADGALASVLLSGSATSPITFEPAELRILPPREKNAPRTASVTLTNQTGRPLTVKFTADRKIQPIPAIALAPAEAKAIPVVIAADGTIAVDETIVARGNGFSARLPVSAQSLILPQASVSPSPKVAASLPVVPPAPAATSPQQPSLVRQAEPPPVPSVSLNARSVPVRAQRLAGSLWELRWARPKDPVAQYRIEERFLALDGAGALQTNWRDLPSPKIAFADDRVTAQIAGLDPDQMHSLKVTALGPNGAPFWESPLVVVGPPPEPSRRTRTLALIFGGALVVLLVLRWRANRAPP